MTRSSSAYRWVRWSLLIIALDGFALATPIASPDITKSAKLEGFMEANSVARGISGKSFRKNKKTSSQKEVIMKFFELVNKTGAEIKIRVLADDRELFVRRIQAKVDKSEGIVHPAQDQYPIVELKISMSSQTKQLLVEECLLLKKSKTFDVSDSPDKQDAGFRIITSKNGIVVTQDYFPIR